MPKTQKYLYSFFFVFITYFFATTSVFAYIVPDGNQSETFASREQKFTKAIYNKYIGGRSVSELNSLFANAHSYSVANTDYTDYYRAVCSQGLITAVALGNSLTPSTPYVSYLSSAYNTTEFNIILNNPSLSGHVKSAAAFDCLLAVSALSDNLPRNTKIVMMKDAVAFSKSVYNQIASGGGSITYYQNLSNDYGNSMAEESLIVASLLHTAALLLPSSGDTGTFLTDTEKTQFIGMAKNIAKWAYSTCGSTGNCSIKSPTGLVVNHQMDPSPIYTLSMLTAYSELAMSYNQLGISLPTDLFDATTKSSLNNIFTNLKKYFASDYTLTGSFNTVGNVANVTDTFSYDQMYYNPDSNAELGFSSNSDFPLNSSFPTNSVDSWSQFVNSANVVHSYTFKDNYVWKFQCENGTCKAVFRMNLTDFFNGIQRKPDNSDLWNSKSIPTKITASSYWIIPGTNELKVYLYSPTDVWHYSCANAVTTSCIAQYVKPISSAWPTTQTNWSGFAPPSSDVDAFSQFMVPSSTKLKSYIFKGDRVWSYDCDGIGTASINCYATYTKTISEYLSGVPIVDDSQGWRTYIPPSSGIESFFQYYSGATLKSYFLKGGTMWSYTCTTSCAPYYAKRVKDVVGVDVINQYRWSNKLNSNSVKVFKGVGDWGFDATMQNSAFSTMYFIDPTINYVDYGKLQSAQVSRDRENTPFFPINYDENSKVFNYNNFTGTKNSKYISYLANGWRMINWDGKPRPIGTGNTEFYPADTNVRVNTHWWMNILSGKNHSVAYLTTTRNKILKPLNTDFSIYDANKDSVISILDVLELVKFITDSKSPDRLYDYNGSGKLDLLDLIILLSKVF